jgi:hypothetical protein
VTHYPILPCLPPGNRHLARLSLVSIFSLDYYITPLPSPRTSNLHCVAPAFHMFTLNPHVVDTVHLQPPFPYAGLVARITPVSRYLGTDDRASAGFAALRPSLFYVTLSSSPSLDMP